MFWEQKRREADFWELTLLLVTTEELLKCQRTSNNSISEKTEPNLQDHPQRRMLFYQFDVS